MRIEKILNNNVIVTIDEGREMVVMGKGIAFGKKVNETFDESKIDKKFLLETAELNRLEELTAIIDESYMELTDRAVSYAVEKLGKKLSNSIYITLADHINSLRTNLENGIRLKNSMFWEIQKLYKDEFKVAKGILKMINEDFGSDFDEHEAANITLHLVNAELDTNIKSVVDITRVINDIMKIVKYDMGIVYREDTLAYYRFVTHLRFFAQRLINNDVFETSDDLELFRMLMIKYPDEYKSVLKIKKHILSEYEYEISDEESMYLLLHIAKVVRESRN